MLTAESATQAICGAASVPVLYKPFLASEILSLIRGQFYHARAAVH